MAAADELTVVFDLGGVLIDWNPRYLYRHLFDGDEPAMERFLTDVCAPAWNLTLDAGRSFDEAIEELALRHPEQRPLIAAYRDRWLEMVAGPITPTVALLERLAARSVPLYALTNWSAETFPLVRNDPAYGFLNQFREIFVSGTLGMVKPEAPIFEHVLRSIGRPAASCLFIDDAPANIATADRLGLRTHHFQGPDGLAREPRSSRPLAGRSLRAIGDAPDRLVGRQYWRCRPVAGRGGGGVPPAWLPAPPLGRGAGRGPHR